MIKIGDIFRHKENEYVYLVEFQDIIYAARILPELLTQKLNSTYEKKCKGGETESRLLKKNHFCFVMLRKEEFKNRAAHLGIGVAHNVDFLSFDEVYSSVEKIVLDEIIREIKNGPVEKGLKKAFLNSYEDIAKGE